ncbi:hypothetical protein BU26DRAFT_592471 [Trematosphaeria pertusa]|uniref:Uncharacterized protein n=1 Tax=Trematosphaeria pertusa TaxID=390896 RepID=A0A6A6IM87_9PLEO|nr:uncharacterized protein BU26DRAFT_592471 [Trematosphaeria pertusa]KAF2251349.1 hypothetical protein BU26DRAFT_592471 [Trematosphaeria pertusa]
MKTPTYTPDVAEPAPIRCLWDTLFNDCSVPNLPVQTSTFFALPLELRMEAYHHALTGARPKFAISEAALLTTDLSALIIRQLPPWCLSSRQVLFEATLAWLRRVRFELEIRGRWGNAKLLEFLSKLPGDAGFTAVRELAYTTLPEHIPRARSATRLVRQCTALRTLALRIGCTTLVTMESSGFGEQGLYRPKTLAELQDTYHLQGLFDACAHTLRRVEIRCQALLPYRWLGADRTRAKVYRAFQELVDRCVEETGRRAQVELFTVYEQKVMPS